MHRRATSRLQLSPDERAPASARHAVRDTLDGDDCEAVSLIVSELVTNALRHSAPRGTDRIDLLVEAWPENVRVEVRDPGRGPSEPRLGAHADATGGYGLLLIERLADRWGYRRDSGGVVVWADIDACA